MFKIRGLLLIAQILLLLSGALGCVGTSSEGDVTSVRRGNVTSPNRNSGTKPSEPVFDPTTNPKLLEAVEKLNVEEVRNLLAKKGDPNFKNSDGAGLIHIAVGKMASKAPGEKDPSKEIIELILNNGGDVNLQDKEGNTALHLLVSRSEGTQGNFQKLAELLIQKVGRGNINIKNNQGQTPIFLAVQHDYSYQSIIVKDMLKFGANPDVAIADGKTTAHAVVTAELKAKGVEQWLQYWNFKVSDDWQIMPII